MRLGFLGKRAFPTGGDASSVGEKAQSGRRYARPAFRMALILVLALAVGFGGDRLYRLYGQRASPVTVILAENTQAMRFNDPTDEEQRLVDAMVRYVPGQVLVVAYGRRVQVLGRYEGGVHAGRVHLLARRSSATYGNLTAALVLASRFLHVSRSDRSYGLRTVLILSDGFPYPGPRVGTASVGRRRRALLASGVGVHAILFGDPVGKGQGPNVGAANVGDAMTRALLWTRGFQKLPRIPFLDRAVPGALTVTPSGSVEGAPEATLGTVLVPWRAWLIAAIISPGLLLCLVLLAAAWTVRRIRRRMVLRIEPFSGPEGEVVLRRSLVPGLSRGVRVGWSREGRAFLAQSRGRMSALDGMVHVRRSGTDWLIEAETANTHLYVGDGLPVRRCALRPGMPVRAGEWLIRLDPPGGRQ